VDFRDSSAMTVVWRNKEIHQPIERLGILMTSCFKDTVGKKI